MFPKRKEPKRKSVATILMRDIQGSAADKLAMLRKVKAAGGLASEDPVELKAAEDQLRTLAAMEKERR
jgi:glutathione synthase/RimK-type ligase-like ATP-grasp enzyme